MHTYHVDMDMPGKGVRDRKLLRKLIKKQYLPKEKGKKKGIIRKIMSVVGVSALLGVASYGLKKTLFYEGTFI